MKIFMIFSYHLLLGLPWVTVGQVGQQEDHENQ